MLSVPLVPDGEALSLEKFICVIEAESRFFQTEVEAHTPLAELLRRKRHREELSARLAQDEAVQNAFVRVQRAAIQTNRPGEAPKQRWQGDTTNAEVIRDSVADEARGCHEAVVAHAVSQDTVSPPLLLSGARSTALAEFLQKAKLRPPTEPAVGGGVTAAVQNAPLSANTAPSLSKPRSTLLVPTSAADAQDEDEDFGPTLPLSLGKTQNSQQQVPNKPSVAAEDPAPKKLHPSQMTREEYLAQYSRAPRRGESGYTPTEIEAASNLGYVMSGSRNKLVQKYIDGLQKQLHEQQAGKLRLEFLSEKERRLDVSIVDACLRMIQPAGPVTGPPSTSGDGGSRGPD
jgi:hypothetical protein